MRPLPLSDAARLDALARSGLMDSPAEGSFDRVSKLAAKLLGVPVAILSLVNDQRQFFKSAIGVSGAAAESRQTPLTYSFCQHVVVSGAPLVVENAPETPLVCDNLAVRERGVIAYLGVPVCDAEGFVLGSFCAIEEKPRAWTQADVEIMTDLAALIMTELALRRENQERSAAEEKLVRQNALLEEAREAAEAASRAKANFLASMSHEIRTPLNAIIAMTELLGDTPLDARQCEFIDTIDTSGEALLAVINDILDLSKIESGALRLECIPISVQRCVDEAIRIVRPLAEAKGLALWETIHPGLPAAIEGDPVRLRQVLLNLLGNAIKFTSAGQVVLTVESGEPGTIRFSVQDTGIGIPPEQRNRLFQPFSQLDDSTTRRFGGTGLGLAISQRLVAGMGGRIWLHSVPGVGSSFFFEVPLRAAPAEAVSAGVIDAAGHVGSMESHPLRILVAEDHEVNRRVAAFMLRGLGHEPKVVADGREALAAIEAEPFDVAFLDVQMPEMDGLTCAREICVRYAPGKRPRLIAMTANAISGDRERCLAAGMDDYLSKPVRREALAAALARCLPLPAAG